MKLCAFQRLLEGVLAADPAHCKSLPTNSLHHGHLFLSAATTLVQKTSNRRRISEVAFHYTVLIRICCYLIERNTLTTAGNTRKEMLQNEGVATGVSCLKIALPKAAKSTYRPASPPNISALCISLFSSKANVPKFAARRRWQRPVTNARWSSLPRSPAGEKR